MAARATCPHCGAAIVEGACKRCIKVAASPEPLSKAPIAKKSRPAVETAEQSRATLVVAVGIGATVLLGGVLLLLGVGVSAWYIWPAKSPDLADAGPRAKVAPAEPKDKVNPGPPLVVEPPKEKDKPNPPPVLEPPVQVDFDPNIVVSIPLKEPQRRVGEILFTHQRLCVGVYRFRATSKEPSEQFELFDVGTMESIARLDMPAANYSPCPRDLGPDGKYFARGTILEGRKFSIWALGNPDPVVANWSLPKSEKKGGGTWAGHLTGFHLLENDRLLTFSGGGDIEVWQIPEMKSLWMVPSPQKFFFSSPIGGVISPDRQRCAVFTGDNFRIHDTQTGKLICETSPVPTPKAKALANRSSAFSSDNAMLVTSIDGVGLKSAVYCYDANTGKLKSQVPAGDGSNYLFARVNWFGTRHYCLSADGGRGKTVVYRANDGTKVAELIPNEGNNALQVGFRSPDPRLWYVTAPARGSGELKLIATPFPAELEQEGIAAPVEFRFSGQGLNRLGAPK